MKILSSEFTLKNIVIDSLSVGTLKFYKPYPITPSLITSLFNILIPDIAKSKETPEAITVYAALESPINLTVKFHINPVSNYTVYWFNGNSTILDTKVKTIVNEEQVQTTYSISEVTKDHLGNNTLQAINQAILDENNQVIFNLVLKLRGETYDSIYFYEELYFSGNFMQLKL